MLQNNIQSQLSQTMSERIFVDFFKMAVFMIFMNFKSRLTNNISNPVYFNVCHIRSKTYEKYFCVLCAFCG